MELENAVKRKTRNLPKLLVLAMKGSRESDGEGLIFRPEPPGDRGRLELTTVTVDVNVKALELEMIFNGLSRGGLLKEDVIAILEEAEREYKLLCPADMEQKLLDACRPMDEPTWLSDLEKKQHLQKMGLAAVQIIDRAQKALLTVDPFSEIRFIFTAEAKIALRLGWEAIVRHGGFPLPPNGPALLSKLRKEPVGMMHFVSASDGDAGYFYTMGIALSPEAQSLGTMDLSFGLDGELIVPGQAVAPIPPTLAMATRLFAASVPTSSNISEEIQSIPYSSFAHPKILDIEPGRGYLFRPKPGVPINQVEYARQELSEQLDRYKEFVQRVSAEDREFLADIGGAIDISELNSNEVVPFARTVLEEADHSEKAVTALFLLLDAAKDNALATETAFYMTPRVEKTCRIIDAARELGLKYVAVCDQNEDAWLPNLLEYYTASELTYLADYSDKAGVILCDGRPVDPVYTAATAAQRIQSVYSTLSVDILKMGMWLCLDALSARRVWQELLKNPHIPEQMILMPIGIIEPYSAFVDNRDRQKTPRPILDPFEKIKFMIEEAEVLGSPSLLTDTRHKHRWVLMGSADKDMKPHVREAIGAIPLIGLKKFMDCEKMARKAGILLGQAGSIEADQIFRIMSETTGDAARDGMNPATAIWTAETERVLRKADGSSLQGDLQSQRRAAIMPYLCIINRTMESHAKLNGWLEFLSSKGKEDEKLRGMLLEKREKVSILQEKYLEVQSRLDSAPDDPAAVLEEYKKAWGVFCTEFRDYHAQIKSHYKTVRDKVAEEWAAMR
jgi:hypothetical protein